MSALRQHRPTHALHRHTPDCCWDIDDRRWRCPGDRPAVADPFPRLPRVDGPPRRRHPASRTSVTAQAVRPVRLGTDPDVDDGC